MKIPLDRYRIGKRGKSIDWAYEVMCPTKTYPVSLANCLKCKYSGGMVDMQAINCRWKSGDPFPVDMGDMIDQKDGDG